MSTQPPPAGAGASAAIRYGVLLAAQAAIGSAAALARVGLAAGLAPLPMSAWRMTIAAAIVLAALGARRGERRRPVASRDAAMLAAAGVCLGLHFALWFQALALVSVARSTLLVTTSPLWVGLAEALILRQRPPRRFWCGIGIALAAMPLVTGLPAAGVGGGSVAGDACAVLGAVAIAAYYLLTRGAQVRLGTRRVIAWTYTCAAVAMWAASLASAHVAAPVAPGSVAAWWAVIGLALIPQLLGHTALNWSLKHFAAGVVGAATLLEPVVASAQAWWFFGERVGTLQAVGAVILLAGVWLALRPHPAPPSRPA